MENMKMREAIKVLREETMACWWPNGPYPGKQGTDFEGIFGEVDALLRASKERAGISANAMFFTMPPDEADYYDRLANARFTVHEAMRNTKTA
jgi:hypothetical protein